MAMHPDTMKYLLKLIHEECGGDKAVVDSIWSDIQSEVEEGQQVTIAREHKKSKQKTPVQPIIDCPITGQKIKTISSFKYSRADCQPYDSDQNTKKGNPRKTHFVRFINKDGLYCEYSPSFSYRNSDSIRKYLVESNNFQKYGVWSNSTKTLPKNWGFVEGHDYITYSPEDEMKVRTRNKVLLKSWCVSKQN